MDTPTSSFTARRRFVSMPWFWALALTSVMLFAATKQRFDLPADTADRSLRKFSAQSGLEVIFAADAPNGVTTNPVRGEYSPEQAVKMLLAGTGLTATQDRASGAFMINQVADPNVERAARMTARDRPKKPNKPILLKNTRKL